MPRRSLALAIALLSPLAACGGRASRTTDTRSSQLSSDREKIAFLARYMAFKSPVVAAEFRVVYHDNSGGWVPGPSDGEIEAVLKVRPQDIGLWTDGLRRRAAVAASMTEGSFHEELAWGYRLLPPSATWRTSSDPAVFTAANGQTVLAVFQADGILMAKLSQR